MTTVRVTRDYDASVEDVFDAWLDPARAKRFLFATDTGEMIRADIDARVGGKFNLTDRRDGLDIEHVGEYEVIDRPRQIVFRFAVPFYSAEWTTLTVDFAAHGGGSSVAIIHQNVPDDMVERTENGWRTILEGLARVV